MEPLGTMIPPLGVQVPIPRRAPGFDIGKCYQESPRFPLKGSLKGDIVVGIDIDIDADIDIGSNAQRVQVPYYKGIGA